MIAEITLEGFGPYSSPTTIELGALTIVTSDNPDLGKSWATVRSLQWCLLNDGPAFNTDDAKDELRHCSPEGIKSPFARVRVLFSDGRWVERYRSGSKNLYTLCDGETEQEYASFGQGFFDKAGEISGVRPVALDGKTPESVNLRDYYAGPFLLAKSPSQIDTVLSRLMGGDTFEDASSLIASDLRKVQQTAKATGSQVAGIETSLERYERVDEANALLTRAEALIALCDNAAAESRAICIIVENVLTLETRLRQTKIVVDKVCKIKQNAGTAVDKLSNEHAKLVEARAHWSLVMRSDAVLAQVQATAAEADADQRRLDASHPLIVSAEQILVEVGKRKVAVEVLKRACGTVKQIECLISTSGIDIEDLEARVSQAQTTFEQALEAAGVCPLCGSATQHREGCAA
ncbi:MAG: hypothetical protein ACYC63_04950 [Armatimonadota bacterium]